jgi:hypothetical protein
MYYDSYEVKRRVLKDTAAPESWNWRTGNFLTEVANANRTNDCGCGVNVATREWCEREYPHSPVWKCRIRWLDLAGVVVPYSTDGKFRCERLELLEIIYEPK